MQNTRPCRIVGLTSPKGQTLNGSAASAPANAISARPEKRIDVIIEGQPSPLSLKRSNVEFFPSDIFDGGVGIGRATIRDVTFHVAAVDNFKNQLVASREDISGEGCRCIGNLLAVLTHLKTFSPQKYKGIVIMCTDLNVSRSIDNLVKYNGSLENNLPFAPNQILGETLVSIQQLIKKLIAANVFIVANYRPHRIHPDLECGRMMRGRERCNAAKAGHFAIYPCLDKNQWDAMEIRYIDTSSSEYIKVRHEIYLDYGPGEADLYLRNAVGLGEIDRLFPEVLGKVDPQAFWSVILHIEHTLLVIESFGNADLLLQWRSVYDGMCKSMKTWKKVAMDLGIRSPQEILTDNITPPVWSDVIKSDIDHEKVASGCSNIALLMMLEIMENTMTSEGRVLGKPSIETLDSHRFLEIGGLINAVAKAKRMVYENLISKGSRSADNWASCMKNALEEEGFGNDFFVKSDPLESCQGCGESNEDLKLCSRCHGVAYCSSVCAKKCWKAHKKICRPSFAHIRRSIMYLSSKYNITIDPVSSSPSNRPSLGLLSEATGTGFCGTMLNPEPRQLSWITLTEHGQPTDIVEFRSASDLEPPLRFLMACGPLADITVAKDCVDEVIQILNGALEKLRAKAVNFTPLEWAAKRGNTAIVDWLCTDERTKSLIHEGCPVGWACYTGRVEIARKLVMYGANAAKTDQVLFSHGPPLLVAAENGQLEAMKYLVEELGQDINVVGLHGRGIIESITCSPNWRELEGHREAYLWAKRKLGRN